MIVVLDKNERTWSIPLLDFHTHVGKVAIETTKGASQRINRPQDILDLYEKLKYELYSRLHLDPDSYYITLPPQEDFVKPLYSVVSNYIYKELKLKGLIADQIVSFPFNDIFHTKTNPKFVKSNEYVRHSLNKFEFVFRFIPFCRVDATDDQASQEIIKSASLGAKGLKLHPLSQNWIDKIISPDTKEVLQTAGKFHLPIIFDVPNKGVAKDITEISIESRKNVDYPIHVVLGHTGFDYSSPEIFEYIAQQGMFTEVSGMRGSDVELFFKNVVNVDNWYNKIVFGTDSNYFSVLQAVDFISFLFSNKFLDIITNENNNTLDPLDIVSKILGLNALSILPLNQENKMQLEYKTSQLGPDTRFRISTSNLITSLRKLTPKKNIFYNLALKEINDQLQYMFYLNNGDQLTEFRLDLNNNGKEEIILQTIESSSLDYSHNSFSPQLVDKFCKNKFKGENLISDSKNIKLITSIEALIQTTN